MEEKLLADKSRWLRLAVLDLVKRSRKGHIGGAFSCADILCSLFYGGLMNFRPEDPLWTERDRFILSKGHSAIALYPIMADLGYFSHDELENYCKEGGMLGGHPDRNIPGIEADTGSLGHGLAVACGMAYALKERGSKSKVYVLLGDGECYEGSVWEGAMFAGHHGLDNIVAIVDRNGQCVTDYTEDCNRLEPFNDKWKSFGWEVKTVDGHSHRDILNALYNYTNRPLCVIAETVKGKGVSFMERSIEWHHGVPDEKLYEQAKRELAGDR